MSLQKLPPIIIGEREMCGELCMAQALLFNVITSWVPFIRRATMIFMHCSTASVIRSFFIIKALFHLSTALWLSYVVLLYARWSTLSSVSPCTSHRTQSVLNCFLGLSAYLKQNMATGNHSNQGVTRTYQMCDSLTLRDMTMAILIIIIVITEMYIIKNSVVLALFNSDPFWWKVVLKKSCRHVTNFKHSYAKSTWFHSWSLI